MAVFRVERTGDYTVMSNFHLKDKRLSLKAKGLLSQMLSLPDDWDYTLSGLSYINRESKDAIRSAVNELETAGYIRRRQTTDASGKFAANEYTIFERPIEGEPMLDKPSSENPITVNPSAVNPLPENPTQLNTKKSNTQKQNTHGSNTDSIPFRETAAAIPPERKGRDAMSVTEIENYRELILENIEYDCLKQRYPLYLDEVINDKKVTDHHAVIPTRNLKDADLSALPAGEKAVLELVALRLLCAVAHPHIYSETVVIAACAGGEFTAKGKTVRHPGWKALEDAYRAKTKDAEPKKEGAEKALPELTEGQTLSVSAAIVKEGKSSPPQHFTEDTLLSAMETAGKEDMPEDAERKGLGTPATRAGILEVCESQVMAILCDSMRGNQIHSARQALSAISPVR